ncbi:transglycosylase SLT domain-containing protein [Colwellia sp. D2M02]|uniref:Transglycosylase SLT domain-containing protein n=1 Tax=Colwellia asteriadis TaxID=517723 RepID=A0ABN1L7K4_9GAMM|nr:transglycosylase SLT domain-containing protein [Colwellia sp. D2M02]
MKFIVKKLAWQGVLVSCLLSSAVAQASEQLKISTDREQQKLFIKAEKLTSKSSSPQYKKLYNQLHYYPLQPYLDQRRLLNNMRLSDAKAIDDFLNKYEGSPLDWSLRKRWLQYLAKKQQGALFLQFFKPTSNAELTCQNYKFSLAAGTPEKDILPKVTKLWLVGKSQDDACDPLFERWQAAGYRTDDIVWQRIALAADGGKHTLLPYLTGLLPKQEQYLGKLWHKVRRDPSLVTRLKNFPKKSAKEQQIYLYGIKRFIWKDQNRAINAYQKALPLFNFSEAQQQQVIQKFALALASKNHEAASEWLALVDPQRLDDKLFQWQLTDLLKQQDWQRVVEVLKQLPKSHHSNLQWQYWYARALIETEQTAQGHTMMNSLAQQRHYYGFLAASHAKASVNLQNKPLAITKEEKLKVINYPAAKRAFEFFHLKRYHQARREWNFWLAKLTDREKLVAAKVANENQWFDRAIFTLSRVGYMDDVALRFPKAFGEEISEQALKQKINPAWAQAITRRESSFMSDAQSSVGARGLMQLMPGTAKQLKRGSVSRKYLFNAENNIKLGTKYLRILLEQNKGNHILATAAYNAGPYRVKRWLANSEPLPADIWIEAIPFHETRNYVKSVLAYQEIYQHKPGQISLIFDEVINMSIGD